MSRRSACDWCLLLLILAHASTPALASPSGSAMVTGAVPAHRATAHHRKSHAPARAAVPLASATPAPAAPTSSPAPVPNEAVAAPIDNPSTETSVAPSVFQLHYPPQGDGYTTGSSSQALDDREAAKATGVEVKVPLPQ